jgi:N-acetylglutamate synthase-like GNAT family acetyltransferase
MVTTRRANVNDVRWLFACCEDFARFYGSKISLAGNRDYGLQFLENLVLQHYVLIGLKDNMPAGFIAGMVTPHHFNPAIKQLVELLWWVPEEMRNTGVGMKLFEEFLEYGKAHCDWVTFTLEENSPIKDTFLTKRGFRMTEKAYLMECR